MTETENLPIRMALRGDDLAALLDLGGDATVHSVRRALGASNGFSKSGLDQIAAMGLVDRKNGELTSAGRTLVNVLLSPGSILSIEYRDLHGYAGRMTAQFPSVPAAGAGVVINKSDGQYHISGFADAETVLALIEFIPPVQAPGGVPSLEAVMTMEQAAVYCVILDALARGFEEEEKRKAAGIAGPAKLKDRAQNAISLRRIIEHLGIWWGTAPSNRLISQVFALALKPAPPDAEAVAGALDELAAAGLLIRQDDGVVPAGITQELAQAGADIEAGLFWEHIRVDPSGAQPSEAVIKRYLIGGKGVSFSFNLLGEAAVKFCIESPADIGGFVASDLAGQRQKPTADDAGLKTAPTEESSESHPASKEEPGSFCEQCGHRLTAGSKFCEQCGHAIASAQPA